MSQHTDVNKSLTENLPTSINDVELGGENGLLSPIGDPLGKALNKGLSPVGALVGGTGDKMAGFTNRRAENAQKEEGYQKFGGNEQTGQNPLGL